MKRSVGVITAIAVVLVGLVGCGGAGGSDDQSAEDVANAMADRISTMTVTVVYNAETDPNTLLGRPGQYSSKVAFADSRIDQDSAEKGDTELGGSIESFPDSSSAKRRANYVQAIAKSSGLFAEYSWLIGAHLVRVAKQLTPEQAEEYEQAAKAVIN